MAVMKRGAKYGVKIYVPGGGQKWVGTFETKREARAAEREAEDEVQDRRGARDESCDGFAKRWVQDYCGGLEGSTRKTYEYAVRLFARDFAGLPLCGVDRPMARRWAIRQSENTRAVIRNMFNHAWRDGLVADNSFSALGFKQSRGRKDIVALTEEQVSALADVAVEVHGEDYGPTVRAMILFAAYTGMRPGEIFALQWGDIGASEVHVRQNRSTTGQLKRPKNGKSRRVVLPPPARQALRDVIRHVDVPWVFTTKTAKQFSGPSLHYTWNPVRMAAGRRAMDFYELRHFCATYLLERGLPPSDVAIQLGHTDNGALVMSTYGHPSEEAARGRILRLFQSEEDGLEEAA